MKLLYLILFIIIIVLIKIAQKSENNLKYISLLCF